jgi:hypothetical protein
MEAVIGFLVLADNRRKSMEAVEREVREKWERSEREVVLENLVSVYKRPGLRWCLASAESFRHVPDSGFDYLPPYGFDYSTNSWINYVPNSGCDCFLTSGFDYFPNSGFIISLPPVLINYLTHAP